MLPAGLPVRITIDVDGSGGADMIKRHALVIFTLLTFGLTVVILGPAAFSAVVAGAYVVVGGQECPANSDPIRRTSRMCD